MKHVSEILENILVDMQVQHESHLFNVDAIRKEKACLIGDIFRVMKLSCPMNSIYIDLIGKDAVKSFDELYDMAIYDLELLLAHLSAEVSAWMKHNQRLSMTSKFIPNYRYRRNQNRFRDPSDDSE